MESPRRAEARAGAAQRRASTERRSAAPIEPEHADSGLEELAKAGAGLAVDAAGVGLKLAGRAAGRIGRLAGLG